MKGILFTLKYNMSSLVCSQQINIQITKTENINLLKINELENY